MTVGKEVKVAKPKRALELFFVFADHPRGYHIIMLLAAYTAELAIEKARRDMDSEIPDGWTFNAMIYSPTLEVVTIVAYYRPLGA